MKGIDIIIVNYFSLHKIAQLIDSINNSCVNGLEVHTIIVSNSQEAELSNWTHKKNITLLVNKANVGFGSACNIALQFCRHEYLLLLNPDTVLDKHTLYKCYNFLEANSSITVLGVKHFDIDNKVAASCSRFPKLKNFLTEIFGLSKINAKLFHGASLMHEWDHLTSRYVNQVMGAFMMIRKKFVDEHGLMDTRFFVFFEDMDFCKKVWLNNGKVYYNADIHITHEGGSSTGNINNQKLCYLLEGKLKYAHKYFNRTAYYILLVSVLIIEPVFRSVYSLIKPSSGSFKKVVEGYRLFYKRKQFK